MTPVIKHGLLLLDSEIWRQLCQILTDLLNFFHLYKRNEIHVRNMRQHERATGTHAAERRCRSRNPLRQVLVVLEATDLDK